METYWIIVGLKRVSFGSIVILPHTSITTILIFYHRQRYTFSHSISFRLVSHGVSSSPHSKSLSLQLAEDNDNDGNADGLFCPLGVVHKKRLLLTLYLALEPVSSHVILRLAKGQTKPGKERKTRIKGLL
jgi:hypothetical protein